MKINSIKRTAGCLLVLLSTLFYHAPLHAQTVTGEVRNAQTGEVLPSANILQVGTRNGTTTDIDGTFRLELREDASPVIRVTFVGYRTREIDTAEEGTELEILLVPGSILSNEIFVRALRVDEDSPVAFENISREEIEKRNMGQDIPYLLSTTPSVTTTSDAGAGIGYTGMRIRGVDQSRINVTINGIPLNDAESHGVFWVNIPDLATSVENIQIQRGAGTSTNGAGAFGASVNMQTTGMEPEPSGEINLSTGSFNTRKANVVLGTGLMENGWQFEGRLSKIDSDGYIDRAFSDLKSFYLSGARHGDRSLLRADVFSGKETTYQAWYGISEEQLEQDRTFNPAGTEREGEPYDNQTDNYQQDHYQLHYSYQLSDRWNANASLHYTYGRGYYEEYKADQPLETYSIDPAEATVNESDLIRRLWLDNHFYGLVYSTEYEQPGDWSVTLGGGYNEYDGDHFGEVTWARFAGESEIDHRYYDNDAFKTDFNTWVKGQYWFTDRFSAFADAQIRRITYSYLGVDTRPLPGGGEEVVDLEQDDDFNFFNPKGGLMYRFDDDRQRLYASLSVANKEPTRAEFVESTPENRPRHETLYDWELGYHGSFSSFFAGVNFYYMDYRDQLILTGEINDVGAYIRRNVADSYRAGVELQGGFRLMRDLEWSGNVTLSRNKIDRFTYFLDDLENGGQVSEVYEDVDIAFSPSVTGSSVFSYSTGNFTGEWISKYVSRQYLDNTQADSRSLDPYLVNDLRLSYDFTGIGIGRSVETSLQVNNILDERYESNGYTFGFRTAEGPQHFNYYYPQAGRNFLLQVSVNF